MYQKSCVTRHCSIITTIMMIPRRGVGRASWPNTSFGPVSIPMSPISNPSSSSSSSSRQWCGCLCQYQERPCSKKSGATKTIQQTFCPSSCLRFLRILTHSLLKTLGKFAETKKRTQPAILLFVVTDGGPLARLLDSFFEFPSRLFLPSGVASY